MDEQNTAEKELEEMLKKMKEYSEMAAGMPNSLYMGSVPKLEAAGMKSNYNPLENSVKSLYKDGAKLGESYGLNNKSMINSYGKADKALSSLYGGKDSLYGTYGKSKGGNPGKSGYSSGKISSPGRSGYSSGKGSYSSGKGGSSGSSGGSGK